MELLGRSRGGEGASRGIVVALLSEQPRQVVLSQKTRHGYVVAWHYSYGIRLLSSGCTSYAIHR